MKQPPMVHFVLGVNYWPRRKAVYWWSQFDAEEVREEFALIRYLGMNVVRIFLLWDDWQPTPDTVSDECLRHLESVCDIADQNQLKLDVTFFTGHMSGPNWSPRWLLGGPGGNITGGRPVVSKGRVIAGEGYRNPFTDPAALNAERLLLQTVISRLRDHPAIWMWNLGNEPDLFAWPPDAKAGQQWVREMVGAIKELDSTHWVTCGLHNDSLHRDNGFRIDKVFAETDIAVMHSYPMYTPWLSDPLDPNYVPYTCTITRALCTKPVLMEEFGGCTTSPAKRSETWEWIMLGQPRRQFMASEEDLAAYLEAVLPKLVEVGALGALVWCFADYTPELWTKPPYDEFQHERFFGLVRPDGSLKPHAEVIRRFAATNPTVKTVDAKGVELGITADEYYENPSGHLIARYPTFVEQMS